jgi:hypothetical protein
LARTGYYLLSVVDRSRALVACGPTFAGSTDIGGADADFVIDGLLLDCKATTTRLGSAEIGQLAGYLLLDYDDQYRITQVGLYLSRQGTARDQHRMLAASSPCMPSHRIHLGGERDGRQDGSATPG